MILVSRSFLLGRVCSPGVIFKFPFQHFCNYKVLTNTSIKSSCHLFRSLQSSGAGNSQTEATAVKQSQTVRLKQAIRDYGATIIVFHVALSVTSLGIAYLAVSNGVDAVALLQRVGLSDSIVSSQIAVGGSTFVMAYAVHKLFAPARIAITLSAAPFIVRYLRRINLIKPPKPKT